MADASSWGHLTARGGRYDGVGASRKIADKDDERRPGYANINEDILLRFNSSVDALLSAGAPEVPDQFAAVHRRLRDAASVPDAPLGED